MGGSRGFKLKNFLIASLLFLFALLTLQGLTLYYFSGKTMKSENDSMNATFAEQLNMNVDLKLKDAEYALKLINAYAAGPGLQDVFRLQPGTVELHDGLNRIAKDIVSFKDYVSGSLHFLLFSDRYLFNTFNFLPKSAELERSFVSLGAAAKAGQAASGLYLISSSDEKRELIDYLASALPQGDPDYRFEQLKAAIGNSIIVASLLSGDASPTTYLALVLVPYSSLVNIGAVGGDNSALILSGSGQIAYDPSRLAEGSGAEKIIGSLTDRPTDSYALQLGGKRYKVYKVTNSYADLSLLSFVSGRDFNADLYELGVRMFALLAASLLLIGGAIGLFWTRTVIMPVRRLVQAISRNSSGVLQPRFKSRLRPLTNLPLRHKFLISYGLLFFLLSNLLTYYCYVQTRTAIEQSRSGLYAIVAENAAAGLNSLFANYNNLSKYIAMDENIQKAAASSAEELPGLTGAVTGTLLANPFNIFGLNNIAIYDRDGRMIYSLIKGMHLAGNFRLDELIPDLATINLYGYLYWSDVFRDTMNNNRFSIVREIRDFHAGLTFRRIGYVNLDINELISNSVFSQLKHLNYDALIVNRENTIVSAADKNFIGQPADLYNGNRPDEAFALAKPIVNGWKLIILVPRKDIDNHVKSNLLFNLYVLLGFMIIIGTFLYIFYNRLVYPLLSLNNLIKSIAADRTIDRKYRIRGGSYDEVHELGENFNLLMDRINKLIRENYTIKLHETELESRKKEAELNALQSQINPHFIYNTLDTINWMIKLNHTQRAVSMVENFSDLLRLSINKGQIVVPIREELQHVTAYMDIQLQRYRERLHFIVDVDKELWQYGTLKLILQPIVENAVYHGTESKEGLLTVVLTGRIAGGNRCEFKVIDDGGGIERKTLERLNRFDDNRPYKGIGLKNVHERIQLYCGPDYAIKIYSIHGAGTTVRLSLPLLKGGN